MKRIALFALLVFGLLAGSTSQTNAQADAKIEPAFSNANLSTLGYQEMVIEANETGFSVAAQIDSGYVLVTLESLPDSASYVNLMQPAEGLDTAEATELALQSARDDIAHEDWVYAGGTYAMFGGAAHVVVNLTPGEWQVAASYQIGEGEEVMTLYPLTVTKTDAAQTEPEEAITIELNDTEFGLSSDTVQAGSQVYEVTNVGEAARQMVLWQSPREITVEDYEAFFASFETGTPAPDVMSELIWVGYTAILSPGQTVWVELDLDPGIYTPTSWIIDPETGAPALLLGMIANYEVVA
jgi:hypothetical protein